MHYGRELQFGTFVTPVNDPPQQAVRLAALSETLGYDLVTFQDHPYQPAFHDTWTLLSWVAARTSRIHVAGNVLNLPLQREPAVLARASASLDLLSGGRFELALGAGGFWDAIEAIGGRPLTPGQAVDALDEAIGIIRGTWDAGSRERFSVPGEYYRVEGAKRGPAPAHDIPIWIGALKPRMLRLIGRAGDGWLPSLAYLQPGDYADGAARIDEAARKAGRNPAEIRRLLNVAGRFTNGGRPHGAGLGRGRGGMIEGTPADWVEQLLPYVVDDGVDTLILAGDDPASMQRFIEEVAPALREQVERELRSAFPELVEGAGRTVIRSTAALAKRRTGIDYDAVPASLRASAIEPGDARFSRVRSTYLRGGDPGIVLQPATTAEVVDAVAFARANPGVPLGIRSAGHGISGRSTNDGGIVIDLSRMREIEVLDEASRLVRIEPGARWTDVAGALEPHGWALSSGDSGGVGVGGLATAGGIGWLVREHGLTIDHLRAVELVLADGSVVRASADERPELFWAVRGAGANVGIVTAFEFEVDEVGTVAFAQLAFDASDTEAFLLAWSDWVVDAPRDLTSFLIVQPGGRAATQPPIAHVMAVIDSDDADTVLARLQPLADAAPLVGQDVRFTSYRAIVANASDASHSAEGEPLSRTGLIGRFTPEFARDAARFLASGASYFFQVRAAGGAVHDVPTDATAYAHREAEFSVVAFGTPGRRTSETWDELLAQHMTGAYLSFETEVGPAQLEAAFPPATLERLRRVKAEVDPGNLFRDNANVEPAAPGAS